MSAVVARVELYRALAASWRHLALPPLICVGSLTSFHACAEDDSDEAVILAQASITFPEDRTRPQLEISATTVPRFDAPDRGTQSSRIDMTLLPPHRSALGLSLGMTTPSGLAMAPGAPFTNSSTTVDLGLLWRYTPDGDYRIDVTAWRRVGPTDAMTLIHSREPSYGARVEMRIGSAPRKTGFVADRGFLGFQLESGARVTLRRRDGRPMIYYRTKF